MAESLDEHSSYYSDDEITEQHQDLTVGQWFGD